MKYSSVTGYIFEINLYDTEPEGTIYFGISDTEPTVQDVIDQNLDCSASIRQDLSNFVLFFGYFHEKVLYMYVKQLLLWVFIWLLFF